MKIKITNDQGIGAFTKITDAETGDDLTKRMLITGIEVQIPVRDLVKAELSIDQVCLDIVAEAKFDVTVRFDPSNPKSVERAIAAINEWAQREGGAL